MDSILYGSRQDCIDQIRISPIAFFELMDNILCGSRQDCIDQIKISPIAFFELCKILIENNLFFKLFKDGYVFSSKIKSNLLALSYMSTFCIFTFFFFFIIEKYNIYIYIYIYIYIGL
jgi:hypothetical protein